MRKVQSVALSILRNLGINRAIASAMLAGLVAAPLAVIAVQPVAAQGYSEGYKFLKAIKDRDGDAATEMLNKPGTTIVNTRDITSGETGLHLVVQRRDTLWVRFLIQRGANPNIRDAKGVTPLQLATRMGFIEGAEELLKGGADVNVADSQGETPLISAVHQRNVQLVRRLLAQGADPDHNDNSGRSARDYLGLMNGASLIEREFTLADEARAGQTQTRNYGPSL